MNAIAKTSPQRAAAPDPAAVAKTIAGIRETYVEPFAKLLRLSREIPSTWLYEATARLTPPAEATKTLGEAPEEVRRRYWSDVQRVAEGGPDLDAAEPMLAKVEALMAEQPDARKIRLIISLMVDRFPNARPHSPTIYLEGLVDEAISHGFQTATVARACRDLLHEAQYPPTTGEFLKACGKTNIGHLTERLRRAFDLKRACAAALASGAAA